MLLALDGPVKGKSVTVVHVCFHVCFPVTVVHVSSSTVALPR